MAQTCALSAPVQPVLQRVSWSNETLPNASKHYETHTNMSPMGWIGCVRCEKFWCDVMARTSELIAPVQHVLHRVSCSNETLPNAHKYYDMHQNMSFGSNGVDWVHRCEKFRCDFVARTFALIAPVQPVLHQASCSNETIQNAPNHYETQQYMSLGSNGVGRVHSLRIIPKWLHATNLCINCTSSTHFAPIFV